MLVILDAEGVVFGAEYLPALAAKIDKETSAKVADITRQGIEGEIDWEQGLRARIEALRGTPYELCRTVAESLPLTPDITEACRTMRQKGWRILVVSGGFTMMFSEHLKENLGLDMVLSNHLVFDENDRLEGVRINVNADKAAAVRRALPDAVEQEQMTCIVDGANDISLMRMCDLSIAHASTCDAVRDQADIILERGQIQMAPSIIMERMASLSSSGPAAAMVKTPQLLSDKNVA